MALTKKDLQLIQGMFDRQADIFVKHVANVVDASIKGLRDELSAKISHLPTKEEYYASQDKIMGELKAIREETAVLSTQTSHSFA